MTTFKYPNNIIIPIMKNNIAFVTDVDKGVNDWIGGCSPFEIKIINRYSKGRVLHLFSGMSRIGDVRVDINPRSKAHHKINVFDFIKENSCLTGFNTVLLDPIYCSEQRQELWRDRYSELGINRKDLYIFPYDTRRTKKLWSFFERLCPMRIIIKSLNHYTIPGYFLKQGFDIYPGAFKPNRCLSIYEKIEKGKQMRLI